MRTLALVLSSSLLAGVGCCGGTFAAFHVATDPKKWNNPAGLLAIMLGAAMVGHMFVSVWRGRVIVIKKTEPAPPAE